MAREAPADPYEKRATGKADDRRLVSQFVEHLRQSKSFDGDGRTRRCRAGQGGADRHREKLWELIDLSASEFADEAARFHGLERVSAAGHAVGRCRWSRRSRSAFCVRPWSFPIGRRMVRPCWRWPIRPIRPRSALPKSCSAKASPSRWRRSRILPSFSTSGSTNDEADAADGAADPAAARRRHREPARSRQRRAGGARRQRSA